MSYINISTIDTNGGSATLNVGLNQSAPPTMVYSYSHITGLITSAPMMSSFEINYDNWKELLSNASNWAGNIKEAFGINQTNAIFSHKLEYEVKPNEISVVLKTPNDDILLNIEFSTFSKIITAKPRIALNLTYSDFLYWLQVASTFRQLITRRGN